jgi:hypothetical protein
MGRPQIIKMLIFRHKKYNILLHFFTDHFQVGIIKEDASIAKAKKYSSTTVEGQLKRAEDHTKG